MVARRSVCDLIAVGIKRRLPGIQVGRCLLIFVDTSIGKPDLGGFCPLIGVVGRLRSIGDFERLAIDVYRLAAVDVRRGEKGQSALAIHHDAEMLISQRNKRGQVRMASN